jgi:hypothetical protein
VSTNAVDWEMGFIGSAHSIAYGNGVFVGVGDRSAIVSSDGLTGSSYTISDEHWFGSVTFGAGMFVASGVNDAIIATSTNGENWVVHRMHTQVFGRPATYANGAFWTVGEDEGIIRSAQMEPLIHARKAGTGVELKVQAHAGRSYRLQRATTLGAWSDFQTFTPQSETTTLIDNSASSRGAFYRIVGM